MPALNTDLNDGDDRGPSIIAAAVVGFVIAAVVVAIRFYTRLRIVRVLGWEDWMILVALVFSLGVSAAAITMSCFGAGQHYPTLTETQSINLFKTSFGLTIVYQTSLCFTKLSILILYLRLLTYHYARWAVWAMIGVVVVYNIWGLITELTICVPLSKLWEGESDGTCNVMVFTWAVIGMHIVSDFIIFFLPIPVFFFVKMTRRKKLIVLAVFTVGFIACIVSILRAVRIYQLSSSQDPNYDSVEIMYWNLAEVNVSIVCACLMTFKPLLAKIWPRWLAHSETRDQDQGSRETGETGEGGAKKTASRLQVHTSTRRPRSLSQQGIVMADIAVPETADDSTRPSTRRRRSLSTVEIALDDIVP